MSESNKAVFLSYAAQDSAAARRICDALRAAGIEVWFDQSELRGGDAWDAAIRRQIKACALFMPIISSNTHARLEGYFRLEWRLAVDRSLLMADEQAFLVPVVIDGTSDTDGRVPPRFRELQWTRLPGGETQPAFVRHVADLLAHSTGTPRSPAAVPAPELAAKPSPQTASAAATAAAVSSVAVLPFVNRSRDAEDEFFSDGLADELLNVLAKIRGVRVAARSSSFTFKGKDASVAEVGRALNVATVLEGSVRKAGNRVRISVQLVSVRDGYHLWSEVYDRTLDDIFAVQDDIAQSVLKELRTQLSGGQAAAEAAAVADVAQAARGRSTNPEAHRLYLIARQFAVRLSVEDNLKAISYLKEALALDPGYSLAWAELSEAYRMEGGFSWGRSVAESFDLARAESPAPSNSSPTCSKGCWPTSNCKWRSIGISRRPPIYCGGRRRWLPNH